VLALDPLQFREGIAAIPAPAGRQGTVHQLHMPKDIHPVQVGAGHLIQANHTDTLAVIRELTKALPQQCHAERIDEPGAANIQLDDVAL